MPISLRVSPCEPEEHIKLYGACGIVQAIGWPAFWAMLVVSQPDRSMVWWGHLVAIPAAFAISWFIVHMNWCMDDGIQRQANRRFLKRYCQFNPWAIGAVGVYALCLYMM